MAVVNAIAGAFLALSIYPMAVTYFPPKVIERTATSVRIKLGLPMYNDDNHRIDGDLPAVAVFDSNGERIGFTLGGEDHIMEDSDTKVIGDIKVMHINQKKNSFAEYISVSKGGTDGVCISSISITMASDNEAKYALLSDIPILLGAYVYLSNDPVIANDGEDVVARPGCFWIDGPNKDGKMEDDAHQGLSWHITDFLGNEDRIAQYNEFPDTLKKSIPRIQMWDYINPMHCVPVFWPPLPVSKDGYGGDADVQRVLKERGELHCGDDKDGGQLLHPTNKPDQPIIPDTNTKIRLRQGKRQAGRFATMQYGYPPGTEDTAFKRSLEFDMAQESANTLLRTREFKRSKDDDDKPACPSVHTRRVVVSTKAMHNGGAKYLCENPKARGPDFVSTLEGKFCDMCTRHLWDVCSATVTDACFDVNAKLVRPGKSGIYGRDLFGRAIPSKNYTSIVEWK